MAGYTNYDITLFREQFQEIIDFLWSLLYFILTFKYITTTRHLLNSHHVLAQQMVARC